MAEGKWGLPLVLGAFSFFLVLDLGKYHCRQCILTFRWERGKSVKGFFEQIGQLFSLHGGEPFTRQPAFPHFG